MIVVREAPPEHYGWLAKRAGLRVAQDFRALEAVDGHQIVGMVGYDGWTENSCGMHVAIERQSAARRLLRPAFGLPFKELGFGVVFGQVLSTNEKALRLDLHLGFREVCFLRDAWAVGVGVHLLEMRREDCRWLEG